MKTPDLDRLVRQAGEASALLRAIANEQRLLVLCHLAEAGELSVGALQSRLTLGQSALSQHLAKLRDEGIVAFRRDAQTLFYRIEDERAARLLAVLHDQFCKE